MATFFVTTDDQIKILYPFESNGIEVELKGIPITSNIELLVIKVVQTCLNINCW